MQNILETFMLLEYHIVKLKRAEFEMNTVISFKFIVNWFILGVHWKHLRKATLLLGSNSGVNVGLVPMRQLITTNMEVQTAAQRVNLMKTLLILQNVKRQRESNGLTMFTELHQAVSFTMFPRMLYSEHSNRTECIIRFKLCALLTTNFLT